MSRPGRGVAFAQSGFESLSQKGEANRRPVSAICLRVLFASASTADRTANRHRLSDSGRCSASALAWRLCVTFGIVPDGNGFAQENVLEATARA